MGFRKTGLALTENEGILLALISRAEPITAYHVAKAYERSPVSTFNTSRGKLYPMIQRLRAAGLLRGVAVSGDGRRTEKLETTEQGKEAIKLWIQEIRPAHLLPEDPLRTKVQSMDMLSKDQKIKWLTELKIQLLKKLEDVEEYGKKVSVAHHKLVHDNAVRTIRSRMDWLELVLHDVVNEEA